MQKRKKAALRFVIHVSTFKPLKGERKRVSKILRYKHGKDSPLYSSRVSRGDVSILSRKIYIPVSPDDEINSRKVNSIVTRYFNRFKKTKQKDFTVTVQKFSGEIRSPYTAKIQGDISTGAHVKAFDVRKFKREIAKINKIRKERGRKLLNLEKNFESQIANIRVELQSELRHIEMKKYRSKQTTVRKPSKTKRRNRHATKKSIQKH